MKTRIQNQKRRRGFTLVELLVVVAIVLVLAGLALKFSSTSVAREAATQTTLIKLDALLKSRRAAFDRYKQRALKAADMRSSGTLTERKDLFKRAFPQTSAEAAAVGYTPPSPVNRTADSAEVLYWLITESNVFGLVPINTDKFGELEVGDTDGDGKDEFIDGWGRPLRFYRWPTRLIRPGGAGTAIRKDMVEMLISGVRTDMLGQDPDDPLGRASAGMEDAAYENAYHTKNTYHTLLIVSAGADGDLGLYEPNDATPARRLAHPISATNPGDGPLNDNFSNRQAK
jgi:prepilin-type N-terminal cleavage/methylation domain-containing protein